MGVYMWEQGRGHEVGKQYRQFRRLCPRDTQRAFWNHGPHCRSRRPRPPLPEVILLSVLVEQDGIAVLAVSRRVHVLDIQP